MAKPATFVYVDGFNLYNGCIRGTKNHWLDLLELSRQLLPSNDIVQIRYFGAIVSDRPNDPQKSLRQLTYHWALRTFPNISIEFGQFTTHTKRMPLASSLQAPSPRPQFVEVLRTDEKGSDVNLATWLMHDAHLQRFDVGVVISNDSDLVAPIRLVRQDLAKKVGVVNPHTHPSRQLVQNADFVKQIRGGLLQRCRLPDTLVDQHGTITCPSKWK